MAASRAVVLLLIALGYGLYGAGSGHDGAGEVTVMQFNRRHKMLT